MPSRAEWSQRVALWKRSGQTASAFATAHGFSPSSLPWRSPTLRRDATDSKSVAFAPLVAVATPAPRTATPPAFELLLRSSLVARARGLRPAPLFGGASVFTEYPLSVPKPRVALTGRAVSGFKL
jgi:hypothetical protein